MFAWQRLIILDITIAGVGGEVGGVYGPPPQKKKKKKIDDPKAENI